MRYQLPQLLVASPTAIAVKGHANKGDHQCTDHFSASGGSTLGAYEVDE